mgnify:CR=1 FL=1
MWNPVKELKERRRGHVLKERVQNVESGEGIESLRCCHRGSATIMFVESGEGIESSHDYAEQTVKLYSGIR